MYDNAPRKITYITKSSTTDDVGPSTYVVCNPRGRKQNYAPFLSTKIKEPSFIGKLNTDALYDIRSFKAKIKGGRSLQNKEKRFQYKVDDDTPGPTTYNAKLLQFKKKKLILDPTKPKLYACAVPYSLSVIAPSIPTKIDENGYDLDHDGNIIKVPADKLVPHDIDIKSQFSGNNKGCDWSHRTAKRFPVEKAFGPGPASYFPQVPKCRRAEEDERFREMARRFGFIPRYIEAQEMKACSDKLPGPGFYDISNSKSPSSNRSKSIGPRPFIRSTARFPIFTTETPGPADYNICDCSKKNKEFSVKCIEVPFGIEAPRFPKKKIEKIPGPGAYEIKGALQEKLDRKKNPYASFQAPFNNTSPRDFNFVSRDAAFTPSPAEYPEDIEKEDDESIEITASVFMSCVERFTDKKDTVGPATYNVTASFDKTRDQKSFFVGKVPFHSSGSRSTTPAIKYGVPCPTSYKNEHGLDCTGHHFNLSCRFKEEAEEKPGPGSYNIHAGFETSTYKAWSTHNLKLKENVLRKKLRLAPRDTRKQWHGILKKRKLLKWFDVGLDYEERLALLIHKLFDDPV